MMGLDYDKATYNINLSSGEIFRNAPTPSPLKKILILRLKSLNFKI